MLLLDGIAGDAANIFAAAISLGALILSIFTYNQEKKIKELTGVANNLAAQTSALIEQTNELKKHTTILDQRFQLEADVAIFNSIPIFKIQKVEISIDEWEHDDEAELSAILKWSGTLILLNVGQIATDCFGKYHFENAFTSAFEFSGKNINPWQTVVLRIIPKRKNVRLDHPQGGEFNFDFHFSDSRERIWSQKVELLLNQNVALIYPPRLRDRKEA